MTRYANDMRVWMSVDCSASTFLLLLDQSSFVQAKLGHYV
jgi:hypothetical protein